MFVTVSVTLTNEAVLLWKRHKVYLVHQSGNLVCLGSIKETYQQLKAAMGITHRQMMKFLFYVIALNRPQSTQTISAVRKLIMDNMHNIEA